jgi:hypothetical protein
MFKNYLTTILCGLLAVAGFANNGARDLAASNGYLAMTSPLTGNDPFTIEMWYNGTGGGSYGRLFSTNDFTLEIALGGGDLKIYDGGWRSTGASGLSGGWHHVAVTHDGDSTFVYSDGARVYGKASTTFNLSGKGINIGRNAKNGGEELNTEVDELRFWSVARSAQEIEANFTNQLVGTEAGLEAYFPFNVGNTDIANGNALSTAGTVITTDVGFGPDQLWDYAMDFDGVDDVVTAPSPLLGNAEFTFEAQIKTASTVAGYYRIFGWTSYHFDLGISASGELYFYNGTWKATGATDLNDDNWHHVALSRGTDSIRIYVDGANVHNRASGTKNFTANMVTYIGSAHNNNASFDGQIDEVRLWTEVRSAQLIDAFSNATITGQESSNMVLYYDFNQPTDSVVDLSVSENHGTRIGSQSTNNTPQFVTASKNLVLTAIDDFAIQLDASIDAYPNPVSSTLQIESSYNTEVTAVFNAMGLPVTLGQNLDFSQLDSGVYYVTIEAEGISVTKKIIKE